MTELCFDGYVYGMCDLYQFFYLCYILFKRKHGSIDHDRCVTSANGPYGMFETGSMIKVDCDRDACIFCEFFADTPEKDHQFWYFLKMLSDQPSQTMIVLHRVGTITNVQDDGGSLFFCRLDAGPYRIFVIAVGSNNSIPFFLCMQQNVFHWYQHRITCPVPCSPVRSIAGTHHFE